VAQRSPRSSWRLFAAVCLAVAALVVAAHAPVMRCDALSADDDLFVTNNRLVTNPSWSSVRSFFVEVLNPSTVAGYYLPVTMTSLMLDHAMGGRSSHPVVFHRTNLALHVTITLLIALLLFRLFGSPVAAGLAALVFGLHPLTVEPVAWLSERKTLLATTFALVSLLAYLEYVKQRGRAWLATSLAAFALALLSKPIVTTLPILLLVLDAWPLRRLRRETVVEKWPWFAIAALSALVATVSLKNTETFTGAPTPLSGVAFRALFLPLFYLARALRPVHLSVVVPPPEPFGFGNPAVLVSVLGFFVVCAALFVQRRRAPGVWTGWLFYLVALAPTFGILTWSRILAWDRYVYFPAIGWMLALGWLLGRVWEGRSGAWRVGLVVVVLAVGALEARGVRAALVPWRDSIALWRNAVAEAPNEPMAHNGLGAALVREGSLPNAEAKQEFESALVLNPYFVVSLGNLAAVLIEEGKIDDAIGYLERARQVVPNSADVAYQFGWAAHEAGRLDSAATAYERTLALDPGHIEARVELGIVRIQQGRAEEGLAILLRAAEMSPTHPGAQLSLAMALLRQGGHDEEAIQHLESATHFKKDWQAPMNTLAWLRATHPDPRLRDGAEALRLAQRVVELTNGQEGAAFATQAAAEATSGDFAAARTTAAKALTLAQAAHDDSLAARVRVQQGSYARDAIYTEPVRANY
jgi:tetratricopeptide (TPR) repeat protein